MLFLFTASLLLWTMLIASSDSNKRKFKSDAKIISNVLETILKPYIPSNQFIVREPKQAEENITTKLTKTEIENAIRLKVMELVPILQESGPQYKPDTEKEPDNTLKLEGNDETTIIEVVPANNRKANSRKTKELTNAFQRKIENFKRMRQNITILLDEVKTDNSTKMMITRMLDEMLALLIDRQCSLNNKNTGAVLNEINENTRKSDAIQKVGQRDLASPKSWHWSPFRTLEFEDRTEGVNVKSVLKSIQKIIYQILLSSWNVIESYRISCSFKHKDKPDEPKLKYVRRFYSDIKNKTKCDSLLVCTGELSNFLTKTYYTLNDTAVGTFRSYAAMYTRDVKLKTEIVENSIVSRNLEDLKVSAEIRVQKVFMAELDNFTKDALDTKRKVNIRIITNFISGIIAQVKSGLYTLVLEKLTAKTKLFSRMKDDLIVNLRMDLDHVDEQFANKICDSFVKCNTAPKANLTRRTHAYKNTNKDVYVLMEISLDDQTKNALASLTNKKNLDSLKGLQNMTYSIGKSLLSALDQRRYSFVNVTRTTVSSTATTEPSIENGIPGDSKRLF